MGWLGVMMVASVVGGVNLLYQQLKSSSLSGISFKPRSVPHRGISLTGLVSIGSGSLMGNSLRHIDFKYLIML